MRNNVSPGVTVTITATAACSAGQGRLEGAALFGICAANVQIGDLQDLETLGVFDVAADETDTWTVGAPVYWSETRKECVASADDISSNSTESNSGGDDNAVLVGAAVRSKSAGQTTIRVRLHGFPTAV